MNEKSTSSTAVAADYALAVDTLAQLNAEIADRAKRAKLLRNTLIASGFDVIEGTQHKAVVSDVHKEVIDSKKARDVLTPEVIRAITAVQDYKSLSLYDK